MSCRNAYCRILISRSVRRAESYDRIHRSNTDVEEVRDRSVTVTELGCCGLAVGAQVLRATVDTFAEEFSAHPGRSCWSGAPAIVPKIESFDPMTGEAILDRQYYRSATTG